MMNVGDLVRVRGNFDKRENVLIGVILEDWDGESYSVLLEDGSVVRRWRGYLEVCGGGENLMVWCES